MSLQCGIVGLPNVGKSTLFNALTKAGIAAENYPFCTIEPNVGVVEVPDPRLAALSEIVKPERVVPAIVEFVDIAGLVAGASKGEGLGNKFLANIRETDAITHVVRCFEDENVIHVANKIDPLADIEVINTELALADLSTVEKAHHRYAKSARSGNDKEAAKLVPLLEKIQAQLDQAKPVRGLDLSEDELLLIKPLCLITAKPTMYVANVKDDGFENNPHLDAVRKYAETEKAPFQPKVGTRPIDGTLLKERSDPRVYLVANQRLSWITSPAAMDRMCLAWRHVRTVPDNALAGLTRGPDII